MPTDAADVKPGDFQQEFDQLLAEWAREKVTEGEILLARLSHELTLFRQNPTKAEQEKLTGEIDSALAHLNGINHYLVEEVKRTDLDVFEKFTFDTLRVSSEILAKDLAHAEAEVKAIHVPVAPTTVAH